MQQEQLKLRLLLSHLACNSAVVMIGTTAWPKDTTATAAAAYDGPLHRNLLPTSHMLKGNPGHDRITNSCGQCWYDTVHINPFKRS
jgi:hypothetical protein